MRHPRLPTGPGGLPVGLAGCLPERLEGAAWEGCRLCGAEGGHSDEVLGKCAGPGLVRVAVSRFLKIPIQMNLSENVRAHL